MKRILNIVLSLLLVTSLQAANDNRYVVIVSLDGCRWDYSEWYDTPLLDRMAKEGVESGLIPSFPSKTFPNHYTLATGLTPDHHGIIHNSFVERETGIVFSISDPNTKSESRFWGGEPLWVTAKQQGVRTAIFYWPGSEFGIKGVYPDVYHVYDQKPRLSMAERMDGIINQLQRPEHERPHLIMAYMEEPDHSGHTYGPHDKRTRAAVMEMDSLLMNLYNRMNQLPIAREIDFLVVSDHGMALITPEQKIAVSDYLKPEWYNRIEGNMPAHIYAKPEYIDIIYNALKDVPHLTVWKKGTSHGDLEYGMNKNCGDIIVSPDQGWIFYDGKVTVGGMHGFDPGYLSMHAMFRAVGPDFRNVKLPHFKNTNIYPLACHLLGITPADCDGAIENVKEMLIESGK